MKMDLVYLMVNEKGQTEPVQLLNSANVPQQLDASDPLVARLNTGPGSGRPVQLRGENGEVVEAMQLTEFHYFVDENNKVIPIPPGSIVQGEFEDEEVEETDGICSEPLENEEAKAVAEQFVAVTEENSFPHILETVVEDGVNYTDGIPEEKSLELQVSATESISTDMFETNEPNVHEIQGVPSVDESGELVLQNASETIFAQDEIELEEEVVCLQISEPEVVAHRSPVKHSKKATGQPNPSASVVKESQRTSDTGDLHQVKSPGKKSRKKQASNAVGSLESQPTAIPEKETVQPGRKTIQIPVEPALPSDVSFSETGRPRRSVPRRSALEMLHGEGKVQSRKLTASSGSDSELDAASAGRLHNLVKPSANSSLTVQTHSVSIPTGTSLRFDSPREMNSSNTVDQNVPLATPNAKRGRGRRPKVVLEKPAVSEPVEASGLAEKNSRPISQTDVTYQDVAVRQCYVSVSDVCEQAKAAASESITVAAGLADVTGLNPVAQLSAAVSESEQMLESDVHDANPEYVAEKKGESVEADSGSVFYHPQPIENLIRKPIKRGRSRSKSSGEKIVDTTDRMKSGDVKLSGETVLVDAKARKTEPESSVEVALNLARTEPESSVEVALNAAKTEPESNVEVALNAAKTEPESSVEVSSNAATTEPESSVEVASFNLPSSPVVQTTELESVVPTEISIECPGLSHVSHGSVEISKTVESKLEDDFVVENDGEVELEAEAAVPQDESAVDSQLHLHSDVLFSAGEKLAEEESNIGELDTEQHKEKADEVSCVQETACAVPSIVVEDDEKSSTLKSCSNEFVSDEVVESGEKLESLQTLPDETVLPSADINAECTGERVVLSDVEAMDSCELNPTFAESENVVCVEDSNVDVCLLNNGEDDRIVVDQETADDHAVVVVGSDVELEKYGEEATDDVQVDTELTNPLLKTLKSALWQGKAAEVHETFRSIEETSQRLDNKTALLVLAEIEHLASEIRLKLTQQEPNEDPSQESRKIQLPEPRGRATEGRLKRIVSTELMKLRALDQELDERHSQLTVARGQLSRKESLMKQKEQMLERNQMVLELEKETLEEEQRKVRKEKESLRKERKWYTKLKDSKKRAPDSAVDAAQSSKKPRDCSSERSVSARKERRTLFEEMTAITEAKSAALSKAPLPSTGVETGSQVTSGASSALSENASKDLPNPDEKRTSGSAVSKQGSTKVESQSKAGEQVDTPLTTAGGSVVVKGKKELLRRFEADELNSPVEDVKRSLSSEKKSETTSGSSSSTAKKSSKHTKASTSLSSSVQATPVNPSSSSKHSATTGSKSRQKDQSVHHSKKRPIDDSGSHEAVGTPRKMPRQDDTKREKSSSTGSVKKSELKRHKHSA